MKLYRNAIILIVVLALMVTGYVFLKNKKSAGNANEASTTETETVKIIDVAADKAQEITIESKDSKLIFGKKEKDWVLTQPSDIKVDSSAVSSLTSDILALNADKVIEENAADLSKYGLATPGTKVTVKLTDGSLKVLEMGDSTPTKDGYYVKLQGSNKVYTIGSYTGDRFVNTKKQIRVKTLFEGKAEDVTAIGMEKGGKVVFVAKKSGEDWSLTAPIEGSVNTSNLGPIIDASVGTSITEFVEENPADLDKYGLKNPSYALEVETKKDGKVKLLLGKEDKQNSCYYAKLDGKNDVFTVATSAFNFLDKPLKEIIDVFAYIVNINDVSNIVVDMDGQTTNIGIETNKDDKDKDKFTVNGKDATMKDQKGDQPFRKYYQALIGVTLSEIEIGAVPTAKPEITFTYTLKKAPGTMKVEFIPKDDRSYYVVRNGKYSNIVVDKKKFDEPEGVRDTYKKLMDILNKK